MDERIAPPVHSRRILLIPLLLYLSLGALYLFAVPPGESPDEPGHLQCIEQVAQERRLPRIEPWPSGEWWSRTTLLSGHMCYHMPLYYVASGAVQLTIHQLGASALHYEFPPNNPAWTAGAPAMFAHEQVWGLAETPAVTAVRLLTLASGLLLLWATYQIARAVFPQRPATAVLATTIVAGWPQFVYMSRAISNDVPAAALAAAVLALLLRGRRPQRYIVAAVVAILAGLTKLTAAFTVVIVLAGFALDFRLRPEQRPLLRQSGLLMLAVLGGAALLAALEPTLRANLQASARAFGGSAPAAATFTYWVEVLRLTASSGWARLGWMNVAAPPWQAHLWWAILLAGVAAGLWRLRSQPRAPFVLVLLLLWIGAVVAGYLRINMNRFQPQFRFAFALVPVLAALAAGGYTARPALWPGRRPLVRLGYLALLLFFANLWLVLRLIVSAYST